MSTPQHTLHLHRLRTFVTSTGHLPDVPAQVQALHKDLATFMDGTLIASLEAVLTDAAFAGHDRADRVQEYRPSVELLNRLRTLRFSVLRDAVVAVAGIVPH